MLELVNGWANGWLVWGVYALVDGWAGGLMGFISSVFVGYQVDISH